MARSEFPASVRHQAWQRCEGRCEGCTAKLFPGKYQYDHTKPDGLGGLPTLDNCKVLCTSCHSDKTHNEDRPIMAKADRMRKKHAGIKKKSHSSFQTNRDGGWKRKMDGTLVRR